MALFGSDPEVTLTLTKIRPTVIRTQNVAKELKNIAKSYGVKVDSLDFNILDVQTYTRTNEGTKESEWELVEADKLYELDEELALLNPNFQIKQMYEVEIFSKSLENTRYKDFQLAVGANATKCKVYLSILANSKVEYSPGFEEELYIMIQKKKIRAGILINIFDEMIHDAVSKITARVRVEGKVAYENNEMILIAQGYEPTLTIDDALILHYDKKDDVDDTEKMDYSSRGYIQNVQSGELLIEYIKPKEGKPGRNCRGEHMSPSIPIVSHEPTFEIDDRIKKVETKEYIHYYAGENGYISFENNIYTIKTDVDVGEISFKTTGSILTGLDSEVSISVRESNSTKDAIGMGMNVEVTEIDIDGNVGSNATVSAMKATIGGQTHKTATIRAENLDINVHKGKAYGKNVHITRLEHGEVTGETVSVAQALGGVIRAREINIGVCSSYVKATASVKIEIEKMQGSENVFTIDPLLEKGAQSDLDQNQVSIKKLEDESRSIKKEIKKYTALIKDGMSSYVDVKKRLLHYQKSGVKMPASFVKKYKEFQQLQENLKAAKEAYEIKNDKLKLLTTQTDSFQDNIFDARIINQDRWVGFNEIRFKLVKPDIELSYKPLAGSKDMVFGLIETKDGEFKISPIRD